MLNKRVGIIGYGSMGSMLLNGFLETETVKPSNLFVSNRTIYKIDYLRQKSINVCKTNKELVEKSDIIFICIKPLDINELLKEVREALTEEKHIVSIAGSLTMNNIGKIHNGKISRVLPTFISMINRGITLVCHNQKISNEDKDNIDNLLSGISFVRVIPEYEFEPVSVLTSCAPGLFAEIFREYAYVAAKYTNLAPDEIIYFITETLYGTSKLLKEIDPGFDNTINRVATKGGSTEKGVEVLAEKLPEVFKEMFDQILERQNTRKKKIEDQFAE